MDTTKLIRTLLDLYMQAPYNNVASKSYWLNILNMHRLSNHYVEGMGRRDWWQNSVATAVSILTLTKQLPQQDDLRVQIRTGKIYQEVIRHQSRLAFSPDMTESCKLIFHKLNGGMQHG